MNYVPGWRLSPPGEGAFSPEHHHSSCRVSVIDSINHNAPYITLFIEVIVFRNRGRWS